MPAEPAQSAPPTGSQSIAPQARRAPSLPPLRPEECEPERARFLADALAGLREPNKWLPCKYFYDELGSQLFDRICTLDEYYPTRTELGILAERAGAMARALGPECSIIEYGSGSGNKTRHLLDCAERPVAYVPVDLARGHLLASARELAAAYPQLEVLPVCADFTQPFALPEPRRRALRRVVYFPGSTIGNFTDEEARELLRGVARLCGAGGALLIGVDLRKDPDLLVRAYDDAQGVTAAFNKNLLVRLNRELGADFELERFAHRALWNEAASRIEMHLVSRQAQVVTIGGEPIRFAAGETICTEHAHKYTLASFEELAADAGLKVTQIWMDRQRWFSVQYAEVLG